MSARRELALQAKFVKPKKLTLRHPVRAGESIAFAFGDLTGLQPQQTIARLEDRRGLNDRVEMR
jgi:hypothetical protein